jgi:hypothetical protein
VDIHVHKHDHTRKTDGEMTITRKNATPKPPTSQQGDYVDYEEVKD